MFRGGAYKPRTSPYAFQGLGQEGLRLLAEAKEVYGLPIVTELMDVRDLEPVLEVADVVQIGARNMQNYTLLSEVGRSGCPVLLKRGLSATLEELLMAAEYILKEGNEKVILCERGIRTFETAYRFTLDLMAVPVLRAALAPAGRRRPEPRRRPARPRRAAVARGRRRRRRRDHRRGAPESRRRRSATVRRRCAPMSSPTTRRRVERAAAVAGKAFTARVKVAVVGVGLIGGSIGLAARERLGARVTGFDPDGGVGAAALARGAVERIAGERRGGGRRRRAGVRRRAGQRARRGASTRCSPRRPSRLRGQRRRLDQARDRRRRAATRASSAGTRSPVPRPPASSTRAPTSSTARPGT